MTIMQVGIVSCLGMKKAMGRSAVKPQKDSPEIILSRRGLNKGKVIKVILTVPNHSENMANRTGSTTKKWVLDSPQTELRLKSYKGFTARDLSAKKYFTDWAKTENWKAYSGEYVST